MPTTVSIPTRRAGVARLLAHLRAAPAAWRRRRALQATRRGTLETLALLSAHQLRDLGIDRSDIGSLAEAAVRGDPTRIHGGIPVTTA